jgi:hypothetical protein
MPRYVRQVIVVSSEHHDMFVRSSWFHQSIDSLLNCMHTCGLGKSVCSDCENMFNSFLTHSLCYKTDEHAMNNHHLNIC